MPTYFTDPVPALDLVVSRLAGVGIAATINPADLTAPGVLVKWTGFATAVLSGEEYVTVEVVVAVAANALPEAYKQLVDLASEVVEELGHPDGPLRQQATLFGNDSVPLPSLVLPYLVAPPA